MTAAGVHLSLLLLSCSALPDIWKLLKCFCSEFFWWTLSGSFRVDLNAWCEDGGGGSMAIRHCAAQQVG